MSWGRLESKISLRPELPFVFLAFALYAAFQLHAIKFRGYMGQDFITHRLWIARAADHPWKFFTTYDQGRTDPPLYYILAGILKRIVGVPGYLPAVALMNVIFGLAGGLCFYGLLCLFVDSAVIRIAGLIFILFLPVAMIHAEVTGPDALAVPLFLALLYIVAKLNSKAAFGRSRGLVLCCSFILIAALLVKFTFGSFVVGTVFWLGLSWWTRLLSGRQLAVVAAVITLVPGLIGSYELHSYRTQQTFRLGLVSRGSVAGVMRAEMNPRSMIFLRPADIDVLHAPAYNWVHDGMFEVLASNKHSLPALVHLAIFTDLLNIYQFDPYDDYFSRRTMRNQHLMELAVNGGVVFSILAAFAVILVLRRATVMTVFRRKPNEVTMLSLLIFGAGWLLNILIFLPLAPAAYVGGYWHPRLILPAVLVVFLAGFVWLDRATGRSHRASTVILVLVLAQSVVHAGFLWPSARVEPLYEPNDDVMAAARGVVRVFNSQPEDGTGADRGYWLEHKMGIVINRNAQTPPVEKWRVAMTFTPGPANPWARRVVRVSSAGFAPKTFEFEETTRVTFDVPVQPGRNDVVVEVLEPDPVVDSAEDRYIELVRVSQLDARRADPSPLGGH